MTAIRHVWNEAKQALLHQCVYLVQLALVCVTQLPELLLLALSQLLPVMVYVTLNVPPAVETCHCNLTLWLSCPYLIL